MRHLTMAILLGGCAVATLDEDTGLMEEPAPPAAPADEDASYLDSGTCSWTYEEGTVDEVLPVEVEEVLAVVGGPRSATLEWLASGDRTRVAFELADPTGYRIGRAASGTACPPHTLVDLTLTLSTADGLLEEVVAVTARGEGAVATVERALPVEGLTGAWDPVGDEESAWDTVDVEIAIELTAGASSGAITLYTVRAADGRQDVAEIPVAAWPSGSSTER